MVFLIYFRRNFIPKRSGIGIQTISVLLEEPEVGLKLLPRATRQSLLSISGSHPQEVFPDAFLLSTARLLVSLAAAALVVAPGLMHVMYDA